MEKRKVKSEFTLKQREVVLAELAKRSKWLIQLRWWVPPAIVAAASGPWMIDIRFEVGRLYAAAVFILLYNFALLAMERRGGGKEAESGRKVLRLVYLQASLDYLAMFLLIHCTGGASSPLLMFLIFHVIFAAILLPEGAAWAFAFLASAGAAAIILAENAGWIGHYPLVYAGAALDFPTGPAAAIYYAFFALTLFITAFSAGAIMKMLKKRIHGIADLGLRLREINSKYRALCNMIGALQLGRRPQDALDRIAAELTGVMGVKAVGVKLLSNDRQRLRYAACYGLPESSAGGEVEADESRFNKRILDGEPFLAGDISEIEEFGFGQKLAAMGVKSAIFVPLDDGDRVFGILAAYCDRPAAFDALDVDFLRHAAELTASIIAGAHLVDFNGGTREAISVLK